MGNCLKRAGGSQQDNTTLLSSNPDPSMIGSSSQDALGPQIPYNVTLFYCYYLSNSFLLIGRHLNGKKIY